MNFNQMMTMNRNLITAAVGILAAPFASTEVPKTGSPGGNPLIKPDCSDAQKPDGV